MPIQKRKRIPEIDVIDEDVEARVVNTVSRSTSANLLDLVPECVLRLNVRRDVLPDQCA
jgi:hypothetical protein